MTTRKCTICEKTYDISEFAKRNSRSSGIGSWCKKCNSLKTKMSRMKYTKEGIKTKQRLWNLRSRYGIDEEFFDALLEAQNNSCGICKRLLNKTDSYRSRYVPVIDHDHNTKEIRGILCSECNKLLGIYENIILPNKLSFDNYLKNNLTKK